ncbi:MAG: hypothetical protein IJ714_09305, partial [Bacteroidales bacterium]|nr:hypothetical protein [Bacteroidales bacterium]
AEVCYMDFSRQFHLWKRERSRSYVTDEKGENGRKGRVNNKSNYFKTVSMYDDPVLHKNSSLRCITNHFLYLTENVNYIEK